MSFIADTGFILSRWSKSSERRAWSRTYFKKHEPPFLTCDAVLMEAGFRLGRQELGPRLLRDGDYRAEFLISEHAEAILWYLEKHADREIDLADACILVLSELNPHFTVLTVDREDFKIYRRRDGSKVPCEFGPD